MNTGDLIQLIIVVLFVGGGAVFSAIKSYQEQQRQRERVQSGFDRDDDAENAEASSIDWVEQADASRATWRSAEDLEEVPYGSRGDAGDYDRALQSRRERADEAQARRERRRTEAAGMTAQAGDPANMTMAERIARARAKAQYQQRSTAPRPSTASRGDGAAGSTTDSASDLFNDASRQSPSAQRQRAQAQAQAQAQARSQAQAQAHARAKAQAQARAQAARQQQARAREQARRQSQTGEPDVWDAPRRGSGASHRSATTKALGASSTARRNAAAASDTGSRRRGQLEDNEIGTGGQEIGGSGTTRRKGGLSFNMNRMTPRAWRDAIILKEIIDPPVSLRDPVS